jgi:3-oxoacyl-[acyl-carrier protein] reductase
MTMFSLQGRRALVTGASGGIGSAIAQGMHARGATVAISGTRREALAALADRLGERTHILTADLADTEAVDALVGRAEEEMGGLDILVNNAGILRDRTLFKMEESDWDAVIDVHLKGHYCCTRPFANYIRESNRTGCRVINFSSVSGLFGNFGQSNYGAAKAGIAGFSRVLALELAKYGCTVNTISPGAATRMTIDLMKGAGREVDPEDPLQGPQQIAPVVTWLASPTAQEITGQIIHVMRGTVGIMQQPAIIRSFKNDHLWTQDELDQVIPSLVSARQAHDERAAKEGEPEPVLS